MKPSESSASGHPVHYVYTFQSSHNVENIFAPFCIEGDVNTRQVSLPHALPHHPYFPKFRISGFQIRWYPLPQVLCVASAMPIFRSDKHGSKSHSCSYFMDGICVVDMLRYREREIERSFSPRSTCKHKSYEPLQGIIKKERLKVDTT